MRKTWGYYRGARAAVALCVFFLIVQELLALFFPMLLNNITKMINDAATTTDNIIMYGLMVFGVVVLILIVNVAGEYFGAASTAVYQKNMRKEIYEKLRAAPPESISELGSRALTLIMNDTTWIRNMQKQLLIFYVYFPIAVLGSFIMLFDLNAYYALFALASVPLVLTFFFVAAAKIDKVIKKSVPAFDGMHFNVKEGIEGAKEIRVLGKAKTREKDFAKMSNLQRKQYTIVQKSVNLSVSFHAVLFTVITAAIIIYGAATMTDVTQLVVLNTAIMYVNKIWAGSHYIITLFVEYVPRVRLAKSRIAEAMNAPAAKAETGITAEPVGRISGIEFAGVNYTYPGGAAGLCNVSIKAAPRVCTAITGGIGSGRSIVPKMLLQYITPDSGRVIYNGTDISEINPTFFRRHIISMCAQQAEFFAGSIRDNLRVLNPAVTDEEILNTFREIGADHIVSKFSDFLNFEIGEKNTLAAATVNTINIVRALLKPASVYVFNQCFDHIKQSYVVKIMAKLKRERRTCIFITQNPWVCKAAGKIYVLKNGRLSGTGVHANLIKTNKVYREVHSSMTGTIIYDDINPVAPSPAPETVAAPIGGAV
jgi:ATP-binding cassette subfamily B protein